VLRFKVQNSVGVAQTSAVDVNAELARDLEQYKAKFASADLKVQRLKEVDTLLILRNNTNHPQIFQKNVIEFREAVYEIFGFTIERVDLVGMGTTYRLRSMYAERAEDHLLFRVCF
jgi:hypothetical protein